MYSNVNMLEDTRNKLGAHNLKNKFFQEQGINVVRSKLPFGDYALVNDMSVVIDTKQNLLEIEGNLTHDHERFRREIQNANNVGIGLVILIEEEVQYKNLDDVASRYKIPLWKYTNRVHKKGQPVARFNVETIVKMMKTMQQKYGVVFEFTTKENCGARIMQILVDNNERYKMYFNKKLQMLKEINK